MKRLSFWEIFQNRDFRTLNCQTAECPNYKFASGESQKLDKLLSSLLQIHKKREKIIIISRLRCLSTVRIACEF